MEALLPLEILEAGSVLTPADPDQAPLCFLAAAQMVVTDLSEPDKRAAALSKVGLCFGIGMICGSTLGGNLSTRFG